jgi:hypothetical protein
VWGHGEGESGEDREEDWRHPLTTGAGVWSGTIFMVAGVEAPRVRSERGRIMGAMMGDGTEEVEKQGLEERVVGKMLKGEEKRPKKKEKGAASS